MGDLEPITRNEKLWSGEDLTPVTRKEMYIKHLYDETQVIPDHPVTREEMFILKAGEELHDVTIEQLTATENRTYSEEGVAYSPVIVNVPQTTLTTLDVTENGTYTAPSGTAYSEVDVDVPLPENAYLLKEIENVAIASFSDGSALPMPTLKIGIEPQQDLHGYDAPWVGGSGKNKWSEGDVSGTKTFDVNIDIPIGTWTYSWIITSADVDSSSSLVIFYYNDDTYTLTRFQRNSRVSYTLANEKPIKKIKFYAGYDSSQSAGDTFSFKNIQLESGSTMTSYAPYSNICPISGWDEVNVTRCGKNLFDYTNISTISDGTTNRNGAIFKKEGTYSISAVNGGDSDYMYVRVFNADGSIKTTYNVIVTTTITPTTFTINNGEYFAIYDASGNTISTSKSLFANWQVQVELSSQPTTYEPYNGQTIALDLDGTRYGGKVDLVSGVMTVTHMTSIYDGSNDEGWALDSNSNGFFIINDEVKTGSGRVPVISNIGKYSETSSDVGTIFAFQASGHMLIYYYPPSNITSVSNYKTWLSTNNLQVRYELATPTTIQLTPTVVKSLRGMNNVYADCGNILDLSYLAKEE